MKEDRENEKHKEHLILLWLAKLYKYILTTRQFHYVRLMLISWKMLWSYIKNAFTAVKNGIPLTTIFLIHSMWLYIACCENLSKRERTQRSNKRVFHSDEAVHWLPGHMFLLTLAHAFLYTKSTRMMVLLQFLAFSPVRYYNCRSCSA